MQRQRPHPLGPSFPEYCRLAALGVGAEHKNGKWHFFAVGESLWCKAAMDAI